MNILLIDDDKVDRIFVREMLVDRYEVFEAETGVAAECHLMSQQINCVLLDYVIPGTDSLMLLREMVDRQYPVILLTGEGNEEVAVSAMKQGAIDYLKKSKLSRELLLKTISTAIETIDLKRQLGEKQREVFIINGKLEEKIEELQSLNRDLESFVHIAAHDLREPIKNLCSYCDLLEYEMPTSVSPRSHEYMGAIRRSAVRLSSLIDDLRALTRVVYTKVEKDRLALNTILDDVLSDFNAQVQDRSVEIRKKGLPEIEGYHPLVRELYRNLVSNALKYGAEKDLCIDFTSEQVGKTIILGVRNNGSTISPEEVEKVFQPFYRLSNSRDKEGTGMGLALCKKIIERHSGKIWVESEGFNVHVKFILDGHDDQLQ